MFQRTSTRSPFPLFSSNGLKQCPLGTFSSGWYNAVNCFRDCWTLPLDFAIVNEKVASSTQVWGDREKISFIVEGGAFSQSVSSWLGLIIEALVLCICIPLSIAFLDIWSKCSSWNRDTKLGGWYTLGPRHMPRELRPREEQFSIESPVPRDRYEWKLASRRDD